MKVKLTENANCEYSWRNYLNEFSAINENRGKWVEVDTTKLFPNKYRLNLKNVNPIVNDLNVSAVKDDVRSGKRVCGLCGAVLTNEGTICPTCRSTYILSLSPENCFRLLHPNDSDRINFGFVKYIFPCSNTRIEVDHSVIGIHATRPNFHAGIAVYNRDGMYLLGSHIKKISEDFFEKGFTPRRARVVKSTLSKLIDVYGTKNESYEEEE